MINKDQKHLRSLLSTFSQTRILCIGDVMLDTYNLGKIRRVSPESAAPVLDSGKEDKMPGAAANVARNIAALGGKCTLIGLIGEDEPGHALKAHLSNEKCIDSILVTDSSRPTTEKIRYMANGHHVLRLDRESSKPVSPELETALISKVVAEISKCDAVVISDYAKGVLTPKVIKKIIEAAKKRMLPIIADPKSNDFKRYSGATIITPNLREAESAYGSTMDSDRALEIGGQAILASCGAGNLLITRGEAGMTLINGSDTSVLHVRSQVQSVFDVVGAGDTVVATVASALAAGANADSAAVLANIGAEIVVGKRGTATVTAEEMENYLDRLRSPLASEGAINLNSLEEVDRVCNEIRSLDKVIGLTNGVFDIVHAGHVSLLKHAREACDFLIVAVNSDNSVRQLKKSPERPINGEVDRTSVLGAFGSVDAVVVFEEDTPLELIKVVRPDVLIKGEDYTITSVVGAEFVSSYGGKVLLVPIVEGKSSSKIVSRLLRDRC